MAFSQLFRPDTSVSVNIAFLLDVRDGIILLLVLLCTACTTYTLLRVRRVLGVVQHSQEE